MNELPICSELPMWVDKLHQMQVDSMQRFTPHVKVRVEGQLMLSWDKKAKPVFGIDGQQLRLWTPDIMVPVGSFEKLVPSVALDKNQKKAFAEFAKSQPIEEFIARTPQGCRPLFEHGAKEFAGYQPKDSVPDLVLL